MLLLGDCFFAWWIYKLFPLNICGGELPPDVSKHQQFKWLRSWCSRSSSFLWVKDEKQQSSTVFFFFLTHHKSELQICEIADVSFLDTILQECCENGEFPNLHFTSQEKVVFQFISSQPAKQHLMPQFDDFFLEPKYRGQNFHKGPTAKSSQLVKLSIVCSPERRNVTGRLISLDT